MFGGLANLITPSTIGPPPEDVPPATPITLPQYSLQQPRPAEAKFSSSKSEEKPIGSQKHVPLVQLLQSIHRPADLNERHFSALGVHVHIDVGVEDVLPDSSYLPSTLRWDHMTVDEASGKDTTFRRPLSNGNKSPEARVYLDRRNELSIDNQAAFRTVRRIKPDPSVKAVRLGNCYEFYRQLELMAAYWDDTSLPSLSATKNNKPGPDDAADPQVPRPKPIAASLRQAGLTGMNTATASESNARSQPPPQSQSETKSNIPQRVTYRTSAGSTMPPELRHSLISAFVKLVSYDFGCSISASRVEPRLHLLEPSAPSSKKAPRPQRASYFPSGCVFAFRTPKTREAARGGIVEGPLAAVSARNSTNFASPTDRAIDFGRELIAALVTAQQRAREGKYEKRFGDGKWWATAKRWGGGEGGPIGREIEIDGVVGDKDTKLACLHGSSEKGGLRSKDVVAHQSPPHPKFPFSSLPILAPVVKKRKNLSLYDSYRMVRLPASNWDKKAQYTAIGKQKGAEYDDVFVISSLFHHVSVLRVRVPMRLLEVLAGDEEEEKSWGRLQVWRSKWFDLFLVEERLEALRLVWGVMAYLMRKDESSDQDVKMKGT